VPWAELRPDLVEFRAKGAMPTPGITALEIGCGLGGTTPNNSPGGASSRLGSTSRLRPFEPAGGDCRVDYVVARLLKPPSERGGRFDFALECYTLQVLPPALRLQAIRPTTEFVKKGGRLCPATDR